MSLPSVRSECGPPPHQEDADTVEMPKNEYSYGEKVKYMCYNKFTMEGYPYLTCAQGEWRGYFTCLSKYGHLPVFVYVLMCQFKL